MFASTFSGYTVVGIPNEAFKFGWFSLRWVTGMITLVLPFAYTGYRLRIASVMRNHQSPVDFVTDRFRSQILRFIIVMFYLIASLIYLSAQVVAVKQTFNSLFRLDPENPGGVLFVFAVILVFEWFGGLVSVVTTDGLQCILLVFSSIALSGRSHSVDLFAHFLG